MGLLRELGIGSQKIIAQNNKVNKSAFRTHPLDGAAFPHFIRFTYSVDGAEYSGGRFFDAFSRCPQVNEIIDIYVDGADPSKYAVQVQ